MHTACTNPTPSAIPSLSAAPSDPSATPPRAPIPAELMARIDELGALPVTDTPSVAGGRVRVTPAGQTSRRPVL